MNESQQQPPFLGCGDNLIIIRCYMDKKQSLLQLTLLHGFQKAVIASASRRFDPMMAHHLRRRQQHYYRENCVPQFYIVDSNRRA